MGAARTSAEELVARVEPDLAQLERAVVREQLRQVHQHVVQPAAERRRHGGGTGVGVGELSADSTATSSTAIVTAAVAISIVWSL